MLHQASALGALFLAFHELSSIDRMTVDVALAALCAGFAFYATLGRCGRIYMILIAAPLVRETGLTLTAACAFGRFSERTGGPSVRPFHRAPFCAGPCTCGTISARTLPVGCPLSAARDRRSDSPPVPVPPGTRRNALALSGDLLALAGSVMAVGLALRFGVKRSEACWKSLSLGARLAWDSLFGSTDVWIHGYGHARLLSPVVLFVALRGLPPAPERLCRYPCRCRGSRSRS
jgi:hypothetical protein